MSRYHEVNWHVVRDEEIQQSDGVWGTGCAGDREDPWSRQRPLRLGVGDFLG